jgi:hypothetical protein
MALLYARAQGEFEVAGKIRFDGGARYVGIRINLDIHNRRLLFGIVALLNYSASKRNRSVYVMPRDRAERP